MKKKTIKKLWKSILAIVGILALALVGFSSYALIYTYIYEKPLLNLFIGLSILGILVITGGISYKKIKNKIKDIFT